ncbi:dermonecrotic toxin domain-containing protein [Pseudomonas poae]|uniref:dermonecrotic toxin domain-containing protein n=1 Tax=Pseudomonas poae TaxID=200451 RepID=UPI0034D476FD
MTDILIKRAVEAQFRTRPTLRTVVAQMLADHLQEKYPPLTLPVAQLRLALPREGGGRSLSPLLEVALEYIATGIFPEFTARDGLDAYLSDASGTRLSFEHNGTRSYKLAVVEAVIRELPFIVHVGVQDALTAYWNKPGDAGGSRWHWFSAILQGQLRAAAIRQLADDGPALQRLIHLADYPARETRSQRAGAESSLHAYSVETRLVQGETRVTVQSSDIVLVDGKQVWLYGLSGRIEAYPSLDAFGQAWGRRMAQRFTADSVTWQLYEPDGNIFEVQAALVLNGQLEDIAAVDLTQAITLDRLEALFESITDPAAQLDEAAVTPPPPLQRIEAALPDWLQHASPDLRLAYHGCLLEQASARRLDNAKTWLEGLDDIRTYARRHLDNQLCLERNAWLTGKRSFETDAAHYTADHLELTFKVPYGTLSGGYVETERMSLVDLALKNLSGKPRGSMTLRDTSGQAIEAWLTPDYVERLVQRVDIGLNYTRYIRQALLTDTDEAKQRKSRFISQRPLELKSQALEHAIKGEAGLTATGADYVAAVLAASRVERYVDNREIVMRPLAFQRKPGAKSDAVQHMFIIEARNGEDGPHLLYRPTYRQSLLQFSSRERLLQAIVKPGELQDSVLAWLDENARTVYDNGGFSEPHYVRIIGIGAEFDPLPAVPAPATLAATDDKSNDELLQSLTNGQLMEYLFTSEARQLLEQADRESTSNAESRWALILEGTQLGFNTLLMLVRGPAAAVGWFVQLIQSLAQDLPALVSDDSTARELAWIDVLLNTAMVLVHKATASPTPQRLPIDQTTLARLPLRRAADQAAKPLPVIKRGVVGLPSEPPGGGRTLVDFDHSLAGDTASARLRDKLLNYKVAWPDPAPSPVEIGALKGLYKIDRVWHASVGGLLFRVNIVPGFNEVFIVHPEKPAHPGIRLKTDGKGHWTLDRGLKLLGGGPKRLAQLREENQRKTREMIAKIESLALEITEQMNEFNASLTRMQAAYDDLVKQGNTLKTVWKLLEHADTVQKTALLKRHQLEMQGYARLRNQYEVLLESLQARYEQLLPLRLELVEVGRSLEKYGGAGVHVRDRAKTLQTLWGNQLAIHTYLRGWADTLRFTDSGEPMSHLALRMLPEKWLGDPTAYNEHVARAIELADILQRMATLSQAMEATLDQLEQDSVAGRAIRESLLAGIKYPQHFFSESLKLNALIPLSWVMVEPFEPGLRRTPQEALYVEHLEYRDLTKAVLSHIEVRSSSGYTLAEQRQVYDTVLVMYRRYEHATQMLKTINPRRLHTTSERLLKQLDSARRLAESELEAVVSQQEELESRQPAANKLPPKAATKRVFKTRKHRYYVGDLQSAGAASGTTHMVITDTMTGEAIARYDQQADGWAQARQDTPVTPEPAPTVQSLTTLKSQGLELIRQRQEIERVIGTQQQKLLSPLTRQEVNPADWDALLSTQASKLDALADIIAREHPGSPAAQDLIDDFRANARDMNRKAQRVTSDAYKQQWPTLEGIDYLWRHKEIDINLTSQADPLRPTLSGDFFTEYAVYDKARKPAAVLWYAHFHYASAQAAPTAYTRAHLKLPEQRKFTQKDLLKQHVQVQLRAQQEAGAEPLGKILYVLIEPPTDQLFLSIAPSTAG